MREQDQYTESLPHLQVVMTADGCPTLVDEHVQQTYRSHRGAFLESLHVFLINSGAHACLSNPSNSARPQPFRCLEIGFGTGLNFLLLAATAATTKSSLIYVGYDVQVLPRDLLMKLKLDESLIELNQGMLDLDAACVRHVWQAICDSALHDVHSGARLEPIPLAMNPNISARIRIGDAQLLLPTELGEWDAIYFDPFSPQVAPWLWTVPLFEETFRLLRPGGRLTTYSVSSEVRRKLASIGFSVQRVPGPPNGKREVLIAVRPIA